MAYTIFAPINAAAAKLQDAAAGSSAEAVNEVRCVLHSDPVPGDRAASVVSRLPVALWQHA